MSARVAAIVRCGRHVRRVYETVQRLAGQHDGAVDVVLVTDASTPVRWDDWIASFAADRGYTVVRSEGTTPGAVKNEGVRASVAPYVMCIDAGDRLDWDCVALTLSALTRGGSAVGAGVTLAGAVQRPRNIDLAGGDVDALVESADAGEVFWLIARSAWDALGGFDASLPALEDYEFVLRLADRSAELGDIHRIDRTVLERQVEDLTGRGHERRSEATHLAMTAIVGKHRIAFAERLGRALYDRQRRLPGLRLANRERLERRQRALEEISQLQERLTAARGQLPEDQRDVIDAQLTGLRRSTPISREWGYERGGPLDRHYIEAFLAQHSGDIRGRVLEVQESDYTNRFGGDRVSQSDVVDADESNPRATVITDLRAAANISGASFDCIILTQTLHVIDDMATAVSECARILRPGGVLLATLPCASRVCLEYGRGGDPWRMTAAGARYLFGRVFAHDHLDVAAVGNVLTNIAFLSGMSPRELTTAELEKTDPYFPLLITVRARKAPAAGPSSKRVVPGADAIILLHHRIADERQDVHGLAISPELFREELRHLRDAWHVMALADLADAIEAGAVPDRAIALTFDDGYADNLEIVSPLLVELGVPATFFLTTDQLNAVRRYEYWWDTLELALLGTEAMFSAPLVLDLPAGRVVLATGSFEERRHSHWTIYRAVVGLPAATRDAIVGAVVSCTTDGVALPPQRRRMTRDEVATLSARPGHTVGAHSVQHLLLPRQPADVQRDEIAGSRRDLEALIQRPILSFAYPFGAHDHVTVAAVRNAGFHCAVTCVDEPLSAAPDRLALPRQEVTPARAARFDNWLGDSRGRKQV